MLWNMGFVLTSGMHLSANVELYFGAKLSTAFLIVLSVGRPLY